MTRGSNNLFLADASSTRFDSVAVRNEVGHTSSGIQPVDCVVVRLLALHAYVLWREIRLEFILFSLV